MCSLCENDICIATGQDCLAVTNRICFIAKAAYKIGVRDGLKSAAKTVAKTDWEKIARKDDN